MKVTNTVVIPGLLGEQALVERRLVFNKTELEALRRAMGLIERARELGAAHEMHEEDDGKLGSIEHNIRELLEGVAL